MTGNKSLLDGFKVEDDSEPSLTVDLVDRSEAVIVRRCDIRGASSDKPAVFVIGGIMTLSDSSVRQNVSANAEPAVAVNDPATSNDAQFNADRVIISHSGRFSANNKRSVECRDASGSGIAIMVVQNAKLNGQILLEDSAFALISGMETLALTARNNEPVVSMSNAILELNGGFLRTEGTGTYIIEGTGTVYNGGGRADWQSKTDNIDPSITVTTQDILS